MAITALGTGGTNNVTWTSGSSSARAGVDPSVDGCRLVAIGYGGTDGGTGSGGAITSTGWTGTAPTWSTPVTAHNGSSASVWMAYSTNAWTGSGSVQASFTASGDTITGCAVVELTGATFTFADDASAGGASTITLSPAGDCGVAAFYVNGATTDHVWSGFTEVFDSTDNVATVTRGSFAGDETSPTGSPSVTPNTGTRVMVGLSFTTGGGTAQPAAISTPITLPAATPTGDILPYVVSSVGASLTASDDPSVTFSGYTPKENDVVVLFVSSTGTLAIQANASMPSGWTNPLGDGVEINSDAHGMCCAWHAVTSAEESGVTTTYTATNLLTTTHTGYVHGVAIRRVDTTTRVDGFNTAQNSGNTITPHVLAGITGSGVLLGGSLVVSSVAKDATGAYSSVPGGWTQLQATNTNQGRWTGTRDTYTTLDTDVNATNITPSAGDEYVSITLAFNKVAGTSGTAQPAALSVPITIPAATPLASSTVAPAALAVPITLPGVTAGESAAGQPAALAVPITLPAVTPAAGSTVAPAAISAPITVPAVTATGGGVVSDDFNRANNDTVGDPWIERQGDWDISSNGVIQTDATTQPGFLLYNVDLGANHWIEATLAVSNGSGNIGLMVRFDDTEADCLSWEVADGQYKLIHADDGEAAGTIFTGDSHDHTTGEKYRATVDGNTLKFFLNDVEVASTTTSTYAGASRVGLHLHENASGVVRWDNFRAGPMPYVPNDTAMPNAIAVPVTAPQATPLASSTVTPDAIPVPITVPTVTTAGGATASPAAIPVTVTLPAATATAGSTVTPAVIPINITLPEVTATGSTPGTANPAAIPVTVTVPQVTPQAGAVVAPAAIPVTVTLPAATATGSTQGTASPVAIQATVTVPQVTPLAGSVPTPAAISVPVSIPQATGQASHAATPAAIPVTITLPAATAAGGAAASLAAVQVAVTLPTLTLNYGSTVTPEAIAVAIALGAVVATGLVPDAHPITFTVREAGYTVTVRTTGTTTSVRELGLTTTAREQR